MSDSSDSDSIADSIETSSQIDASIGSKSSAQLLAAAGAGEEENTPRPRSNESSDGHDGRAEEESHNDTVDDVALLEYAEYRDGSKTPEYGAEGLVKLWDRPKEEDISEHPNKVLNDLDIVVVHGLWGTRRPPFTSPGAGTSDWLDLAGNCGRVMTFGYDASQLMSGMYTQQAFEKIASRLLEELTIDRSQAEEKRPIMFVAHDLGGIIVKCALTIAGLQPRLWGEVFDSTRILVFYGCPHKSKNHDEMEDILSRFLYRPNPPKHPGFSLPTASTHHLARAVEAINDLFLDSKHTFRSQVLSVYSDGTFENLDKIFGPTTSTMSVPFEIRLEDSPKLVSRLQNHIDRVSSLVKVDNNILKHERLLLSVASPLPYLESNAEMVRFAWISTNGRYESWYNQRQPQILYLQGNRSDTQAASEYIYHDLDKSRVQSDGHVNLYFSFNRHDVRRDSIQDMLATFLAQTLGHLTTIADSFQDQFEQHRDERSWNFRDLLNWLQVYKDFGEVDSFSCVLNNFDECEPTSRKAFLDDFSHISDTQERAWRVVVTTSEPDSLVEELSRWPTLDVGETSPDTTLDEVTNSQHTNLLKKRPEIRLFKEQLDEDVKVISALEPEIQELLLSHISSNKQWPSRRRIGDMLGPVEELSLQACVEKILGSVPDQEFVFRTLAWVLYAVRPPTLWELAVAVTWTPEQPVSNDPILITSIVDEVVGKLRQWLAGIVSIHHTEIVVSSSRVREALTSPNKEPEISSMAWRLRETANITILKTCFAYLAATESKERLSSLYDDSFYEDNRLALVCDRTSLADYAAQFLVHHLSQAAKSTSYTEQDMSNDLESFVESGAVADWSKAHWLLANPFTRSQAPFESLYPALASVGLAKEAERWRDGDQDLSAGLVEACLNGSRETARQLFSRTQHSVETLKDALTSAGAYGDEAAWIDLITGIQETYPDFPWKTQISLVARAGWLRLTKVLAKLLQAGCPVDEVISSRKALMTPIRIIVSRSNNIEGAKLLLDHGVDMKQVNEYGSTLVNAAASYGFPDMVRLLASHGADINALKDNYTSAIYAACLWGEWTAVKALVELGADMNRRAAENQDEPAWSPLLCAVSENHIECTHALLEGNADVNTVGPDGTPIRYAVAQGLLEICKSLLNKGADLSHESITPPILVQSTSTSVKKNRMEIVRLLVENGAHINATDEKGNTPLAWACVTGDPDRASMVEYLLEHGADVNCRNKDGDRPIHLAVWFDMPDVLEVLLKQEKIDLEPLSPYNMTPLNMAVREGFPDLAETLLERGANPDSKPEGETTALFSAVRENSSEMVRLLVQHKAQIDTPEAARSSDTWESMEYAVFHGHSDIIRILGDAGADVHRRFARGRTLVHVGIQEPGMGALLEFRPALDIKCDKGNTPLHEVTKMTPLENIRLLVRAGSDINITNESGKSPLIIALENGNQDVARFYVSRDANVHICSLYQGSALHAACLRGYIDLAKEFIAAGVDVNVSSALRGTPLTATLCGDPEAIDEMIDILVKAGADLNASAGLRFGTVGVAAAWGGETRHIQSLVAQGASFVIGDSMGRVPLHIATLRGKLESMSDMLEAGANVDDKDNCGRNMVSWAAQSPDVATLRKVVDLVGKDAINEPDLSGWTPLCWAARGQGSNLNNIVNDDTQQEMIEELIRLGADRRAKSHIEGKEYTAAGIAMYHGCSKEVIELLTPQSHGENTSNQDHGMPQMPKNARLEKNFALCDYCLFICSGVFHRCKTCFGVFVLCYKCHHLKNKIHPLDHEFEPEGTEFEMLSEKTASSRASSPAPSSSRSAASSSDDSDDDSDDDDNDSKASGNA